MDMPVTFMALDAQREVFIPLAAALAQRDGVTISGEVKLTGLPMDGLDGFGYSLHVNGKKRSLPYQLRKGDVAYICARKLSRWEMLRLRLRRAFRC